MCGIAGIFSPAKEIDSQELERFTLALHHRGPDSHASKVFCHVGLAHTRLAILDLSERGANPLLYTAPDSTRYWITFNGEIFNFIELRQELIKLGHRFVSDTDTEVIPAAYHQWGMDCFKRFNGMWAFALYNEREGSVLLSRDRFGIKPLYFRTNDRLAWSSELKAFFALSDTKREIDSEVVPLVLQHSYSYEGKTERTLLKSVNRLPPGSVLIAKRDGTITTSKWWRTEDNLPSVPESYAGQVEKFREIFFDSVRLRMRSDVPIATCLSGGLDSSSVACVMNLVSRSASGERQAEDWQNCFIASFPGAAIDETDLAEDVAQAIGAKSHKWVFDGNAALQDLVSSVWSLEDVYGGIVVPIWSIYRELRRSGVVVSLDGHGSDELFGGYSFNLDWSRRDFARELMQQFHVTLLPAILRNFDRCSAAHGIEVRMPFMDWRLVTYCMALPPESRAGAGYSKRILRDAMEGIVPDRIRLRRQKIGFNSPMIEWYNGEMLGFFEWITQEPLWKHSQFFDGTKIGDEVLRRCRNRSWTTDHWDDALFVWTLANLVLWQMLFIEGRQLNSFHFHHFGSVC